MYTLVLLPFAILPQLYHRHKVSFDSRHAAQVRWARMAAQVLVVDHSRYVHAREEDARRSSIDRRQSRDMVHAVEGRNKAAACRADAVVVAHSHRRCNLLRQRSLCRRYTSCRRDKAGEQPDGHCRSYRGLVATCCLCIVLCDGREVLQRGSLPAAAVRLVDGTRLG